MGPGKVRQNGMGFAVHYGTRQNINPRKFKLMQLLFKTIVRIIALFS